jgi:hypothetical protein
MTVMRSVLNSLVALAAAALLASSAARAAVTGEIVGTVPDGKAVAAVTAVNRTTGKKHAGTIERATGRFAVPGLGFGHSYDLVIDFGLAGEEGSCRLEGVNLSVPPSDYEEEQPLEGEDVETIQTKVRRLDKFAEHVEVLAIRGNIQHAAVLVSRLRTGAFYNSKPGEVVWRMELLHFERPEETWVKVQDELFVILYRERIQQSAYEGKSITFDPRLGGLATTSEEPRLDVGTIEPPEGAPGIRFRRPGEDDFLCAHPPLEEAP